VLGLVALYGLWLRDASLVRIEQVEVRGLSGPDAPRLRGRLVAAARRMTTLNVRPAPLERVLAGHPALQRVEVDPALPHRLEVTVVEYRAVARLRAGRREGPPVAADGTILRGLYVRRPLPVVDTGSRPPRRARRLRDRRVLRLVRTLGAAPAPLDARVGGAIEEPFEGVVVRMRGGPRIMMGSLARLEAKWAAATRVLADPGARGAAYVDVRLPERPVAGGLPEKADRPRRGVPSAGHEPAAAASEPTAYPDADAAAPAHADNPPP
jgi:hypothetical protein